MPTRCEAAVDARSRLKEIISATAIESRAKKVNENSSLGIGRATEPLLNERLQPRIFAEVGNLRDDVN